MKTTIKVAELASFMYAILVFGSFCINAAYYKVFGIDISAYMSLSEILLLFLGQPILYIPVLLTIAWITLISKSWTKGPCSIHRVYSDIALRNDMSFLIISCLLLVLIKEWHNIPTPSVIIGVLSVFYVMLSFLPSLMNAIITWQKRHYSNENKTVDKKDTKESKKPFSFKGVFRRIVKGFTEGLLSIPSSISANRQKRKALTSSPRWKILKKANAYRTYIRDHVFSDHEISRLRWIYNNPLLYSFILVSSLSIILMTLANYHLAQSIKDGFAVPSKQASFVVDGMAVPRDSLDSRILIGESQKYLFLFDTQSESAEVFSREEISNLRFHVSYPTSETRGERFKKGVKELFFTEP